jgi:tRNA threonylcarbamoyladenosine biosynthesis protein TsaE
MITHSVNNLSELPIFVLGFLNNLPAFEVATVVALSGDLGAGKTTFVQTLAKELGVTDTVTSPTFTIMKSYATTSQWFENLVHLDVYRLEDINETTPLRLSEILKMPNTLVCIEWAEKIKEILPANTIYVDIKSLPNEVREITITNLSV